MSFLRSSFKSVQQFKPESVTLLRTIGPKSFNSSWKLFVFRLFFKVVRFLLNVNNPVQNDVYFNFSCYREIYVIALISFYGNINHTATSKDKPNHKKYLQEINQDFECRSHHVELNLTRYVTLHDGSRLSDRRLVT